VRAASHRHVRIKIIKLLLKTLAVFGIFAVLWGPTWAAVSQAQGGAANEIGPVGLTDDEEPGPEPGPEAAPGGGEE